MKFSRIQPQTAGGFGPAVSPLGQPVLGFFAVKHSNLGMIRGNRSASKADVPKLHEKIFGMAS